MEINKQIPNLTEEQDHQVRRLCLEKGLTFFQAFKKIFPIYNHIFRND